MRAFAFKGIKISNNGDYVLQSVSNLETGAATSRKVEYIDTDGCELKDIWYNERKFEVRAFIDADSDFDMVKLKRRLIKACSLKEPFRLYYFNRKDKYSALCYMDKLPVFDKRTGWRLPFELYFTIPGFYWESPEPIIKNVFKRTDKIQGEFKLPCVFTERTNAADIYIDGDCETYPVFEITCESDSAGDDVVIKNNSTNKQFKLNYKLSQNEKVLVDTFNKSCVSDKSGNVTSKLTLDSELFPLEVGDNNIECISVGNTVKAIYRERMLGV